MDIEKLIEQLNGYFEGKDLKRGVALDAATALSTLQAENEKLRAELENYRKGHREDAISALSPPNEPLTLEQLREMDGEPVWVTPTGFWALVISKRGQRVQLMCSDGETVWADKEIELVGPVYRRLPEGEENAQ